MGFFDWILVVTVYLLIGVICGGVISFWKRFHPALSNLELNNSLSDGVIIVLVLTWAVSIPLIIFFNLILIMLDVLVSASRHIEKELLDRDFKKRMSKTCKAYDSLMGKLRG